jgi:hypothetical protein
LKRFLLVIILFGLFGCSAFLEARKTSKDLQLFIGKKAYEEFLSEYGPPAKIVTGEKVFLSVWLFEMQGTGSSLDPEVKAFQCCKFKILMLYFDNDTKILKDIAYIVPL